jgi:hypothetical protein
MNPGLATLAAFWRGWYPHWLSQVRAMDGETWLMLAGFVAGQLCLFWLWARLRGGR